MTLERLSALRTDMEKILSPYRMAHTLGVEAMVARLASLYCPEKTPLLRGAALLHDMTKEYSNQQHMAIFRSCGVELRPDEAASPQVWHGMTAALVIPTRYPDFSQAELLSAVRWHTTGRAEMTLCDALLCLADFIEEGRTFADCVALRRSFFDPSPENMSPDARRRHLRNVLLTYFEITLSRLREKGGVICLDTLAAREDLYHKNEL